MTRANDEVEAVLLEYADLLSILSEDRFKPRAYEKAARAVGGYPAEVDGLDLKAILQIPSVGKSIGEKIHEFLTTGAISSLEDLRAQIPSGVRAMMGVQGLGPKKAMALYRELGISSVDELRDAVAEHRLADLKGFGPKTEENILRGIERIRESGGRVRLNVALDLATELLAVLEELKGVQRSAFAGSLRRMAETIGDVDLLVASDRPEPIMDAFASLAHGRSRLGQRRNQDLDTHQSRFSGRSSCGARRGLGRCHDLLHRFKGPQRPDPRDGCPQGLEALRVRTLPCEVG